MSTSQKVNLKRDKVDSKATQVSDVNTNADHKGENKIHKSNTITKSASNNNHNPQLALAYASSKGEQSLKLYKQPSPRLPLPAALLYDLEHWPTLTFSPTEFKIRDCVMHMLKSRVDSHEKECKTQCQKCIIPLTAEPSHDSSYCLECWRPQGSPYSYDFAKNLRLQVQDCKELCENYERLIKEKIAPWVFAHCGEEEHCLLYQFPPTLRVHPSDGRTLGRPHRDSEYGHQPGEINIWMPITCIRECLSPPSIRPLLSSQPPISQLDSPSSPSSPSSSASCVCLQCGRVFKSALARIAHQRQSNHSHSLPSLTLASSSTCASPPAPISIPSPSSPRSNPLSPSSPHSPSSPSCSPPSSSLSPVFPTSSSENFLSETSLWAESAPGKGDFQPFHLHYGEMRLFYGVQCLHGSVENSTGTTRVSLDFRVAPESCFDPSWQLPGVSYRHEMRRYERARQLSE